MNKQRDEEEKLFKKEIIFLHKKLNLLSIKCALLQ